MRELFLLDPDIAFLNHGSFGACPLAVLEAQQQWQREMERNPVEFLGRRSAALLAGARESLAHAMGAPVKETVFVSNATTGVNTVARSLKLAPGDEILTTDLEYGACDATWHQVCAHSGASYRRVEIPMPYERERVVSLLMAAVTPRTRLIYVSHLTSATALILPVERICAVARERGILTLVDGAHAPGQIPVNLSEIGADFYVGNCHKWMCAPKGSAFLYAKSEHHPMLEATVSSWGYAPEAQDNSAFESYLGTTLFERRLQWQGTRDIAPWLAVPAAIEFQQAHRWETVRTRSHEWARHALETLTRRHGLSPIAQDDDWAQMVAIPVPCCDPGALRRRLYAESGIEVQVSSHRESVFLRVSIQGYNSEKDVERLLAAPALAVT